MNKIISAIKRFFNSPKPLIFILSLICIFLLMYIFNLNKKNKIFIGEVKENDVVVENIHYFINNDMNYFFASNAYYLAEDKDIYSYEVGYYVIDSAKNNIEFLVRRGNFEKKSSLKDVVNEMSGWDIGEANNYALRLNKNVTNNISNLHFYIKASTDDDLNTYEINIDYPVSVMKLTK